VKKRFGIECEERAKRRRREGREGEGRIRGNEGCEE
jgi:hypothetical protein